MRAINLCGSTSFYKRAAFDNATYQLKFAAIAEKLKHEVDLVLFVCYFNWLDCGSGLARILP